MPPQPQGASSSGPSIQTVIFDPKFRALDSSVQQEVLAHIDSKYRALGDDDQKAVLTQLMSPPTMPTPTVAMQGEAKPRTWGGGETLDEKLAKMTPEQRARLESGSSMSIPIALATAPLLPGPTKGAAKGAVKAVPWALRALKGAAIGGATSGGLYVAQRGIHGELPDIKGTAIATGTGAAIGGIAESMLQIPGVRRAIARIPKLKEFMAPSKAEEFDAQMEQKAQDLMRRGKEQEALDLKQAMAARRATRAAQQEAKTQAEAVESAKFKPSPGVKRSMGPSGTRAYDPQADAGFSTGSRPRAKGLPAPPRPTGEEGAEAVHAGGSGVRPSPSEARITYLIRKPVLTPDEAAELERALGPRWKLMRGQGIMQHQAETLGLVRARRAAQGMPEPH